MILLDYAFATFATVAVAWSLLNIGLPSKMTKVNIVVLSFAFLAAVIAVFSGAPLLTGALLYPEALSFVELADLFAFMALTAVLSTLVLEVEGPAVKVLKRLGVDRSLSEVGFTFVHGLATALLMILISRFMPGVELMTGAALTAGLIGAFGFYFAEQVFVHSGSTETEKMALAEAPFEEEEDY